MEYRCICGKVFNSSQAINSHKAHCETYLKSTGKWERIKQSAKIGGKKSADVRKANNIKQKELDLAKWIAEKHICEHCGKIMTKKFGSGRFCSRACANSRDHSAVIKQKISKSMIGKTNSGSLSMHNKAVETYYTHPKYCKICGRLLEYDLRKRNVCSKECLHIQMHNRALKTVSTQHNNKKQYKYGTYNGISCDSSWELAYVVYCLDHNINIKRNTQGFDYVYKNEKHKYYPDFIVDGVYTEIKNYWSEQVQAKIDYFPKHLKYNILYKADVAKYLAYCKDKYGKDFINKLYQK